MSIKEIDDDLVTARQLASQKRETLGQVISELARQSLTVKVPQKVRNCVLLFAPKAHASKPDLRFVNTLRDGS